MQELMEITGIRQDVDGWHKRWFTSATEDLYVWSNGRVVRAFEYCFDKDRVERAIRWHCDYAPSYTCIDNGDHPGGYKRSPLLVAGDKPDITYVVRRFCRSARLIESSLFQAIVQRIRVL